MARANTSKTPLSCLGAGQIFVRVTFYCVFDRRLNLTLIMQQRDRSQRGSADSTRQIFFWARQIFFWLDIWNCPSQSRFLAIVRIDPYASCFITYSKRQLSAEKSYFIKRYCINLLIDHINLASVYIFISYKILGR